MKTQDLVDQLALDLRVHPEQSPPRLWARLTVSTLVASALTLAAILTLLSRSPHLMHGPGFTIVVTVIAGFTLAATAFWAVVNLSYPESHPSYGWLLVPLVVMITGIGFEMTHTPVSSWSSHVWGTDPLACFLCVASLSIPILAAVLLILRDLAPSSPRMAGAMAGLLAGGITAALYTIHCPEDSLLFIAAWHIPAILLVAACGALAGGRLLRW